MRPFYSLLILALALPAAACAQQVPAPPSAAELLHAQEGGPQFYLGVAAATPVYWRDPNFEKYSSGWAYLTAFAGVRFNTHWLAQVGFNATRATRTYEIAPGVSGPGPAVGTATSTGSQTAVPVLVRYSGWTPSPGFTLEAFAGITPLWQRYEINEVSGVPGQVAVATNIRDRATIVHATVGLAGVFGVGPGADLLVEAGLNQRVFASGTSYLPVRTPMFALGFRYRFVHLPRSEYLRD